MSVINRDEALRATELAEESMKKSDFIAARKLATKAEKMDPTLDNISRMLMVCEVHCTATEKKFGNEMDWYGILQVDMNASDIIIKKQYKRLALLLHPDKNKLPGAESAFKLIGEAQRILLDREKRSLHDIKRKSWRKPAAPLYRTQPVVPPTRNWPPPHANARPTFWTSCSFCQAKFEYPREYIRMNITCKVCGKQYCAYETAFQSVPLGKTSGPTPFPPPPATVFPRKQSVPPVNQQPQRPPDNHPMPQHTAAGNNNGKRKRKNTTVESSDSSASDSETSSEFEENVDLGCNEGRQPRRSDRSKQKVSYNENVSDDEVDMVNDNGEGSKEDLDTEMKDEMLKNDDQHHSTETLPNGVNSKEKIVEEEGHVESASDSEDEEVKPNIINCDDPDFNDFDKERGASCFRTSQVWALYDEPEGLPRFYALIKSVRTSPKLLIKYVWLEAEEQDEEENETDNKLPVSVGEFELGEGGTTDSCSIFSHLVHNKTRARCKHFTVFPSKGEIWALYKFPNSDSPREYEFVEVLSDYVEGGTISVGFLTKVEGFSCVFSPMPEEESDTFEIPPQEMFRFSHRIPSFRLKGTEGRGVIEGWYELDPAALPVSGSQQEATAQGQDQQSSPPS